MTGPWYEKLNGWPVAIAGVLVLGGFAYYARLNYAHIEAERVATFSELEAARNVAYDLMRAVEDREAIINGFQEQIGSIASTVGTLDKLAHTDEELLKKYSKIYFLNENYIPAELSDIAVEYRGPGATNTKIHGDVWPHLKDLLEDAHDDGVELLVQSAYRSFSAQSSLKSAYKVNYGSGANAFSADQGYSEHQLGTALDFTTKKLGANFNPFASDPAYTWLLNHAHKYGFVISYPEKNKFYVFEPWHWRYVGIDLASDLHEDGKYFYDLDQREIDTYLVKLF